MEAVKFQKPVFGNHSHYLASVGVEYYHPPSVTIGGKGNGEQTFRQQPYYAINTLEGYMRVEDGDWIITGVKVEKYPCKPDIFEATYEQLEA